MISVQKVLSGSGRAARRWSMYFPITRSLSTRPDKYLFGLIVHSLDRYRQPFVCFRHEHYRENGSQRPRGRCLLSVRAEGRERRVGRREGWPPGPAGRTVEPHRRRNSGTVTSDKYGSRVLIIFMYESNSPWICFQVPEMAGGVRVVSEARGSQLLVGTTRNCIYTGSLSIGLSMTLSSHIDELWGLAVHPSLPQFLTAAFDRMLNLWDSMSHSLIWSKDLPVRADKWKAVEPRVRIRSLRMGPDGLRCCS